MRRIPFVCLAQQTAPLLSELLVATERVLRSGYYILGPEVEAFEAECAAYFGVPYAIGVNSGTDALLLAIKAVQEKKGPGGGVIVPAITFVASAAAVVHAGETVRFADIDSQTGMLTAKMVEAATEAPANIVMSVHLYGAPQPGDWWKKGWIIEDCAEAFGARWPDGCLVGTRGTIGCFSFVPTKNLGGYGDGGLVITSLRDVEEWVRRLRDHGRTEHTTHVIPGYNSRLDELQAALLRVKLPHLEQWNMRRRMIVRYYQGQFAPYSDVIRFPKVEGKGSYQVCVILVPPERRNTLCERLIGEYGIEVKIHYSCPVPLQPAFHSYVLEGQTFPNALLWSRSCLTLPNFPEMTDGEVEYVAESVEREVQTCVSV